MKTADINLIAFIGKSDYVQTAYADLRDQDGIVLVGLSCFDYYSILCKKLHVKPLSIIYFFLSIYFLFKYCCKKKNNIFLFHGVDFLWLLNLPLIKFAKKWYNTKIVGYYWDIIDYSRFSVASYKDSFDLIITIDDAQAEKDGVEYYPIFYSEEYIDGESENCDVFFCGEDGGRLCLIEKIYSELTKRGFVCDFYCSRSPNAGNTINGIKHIQNMPHLEYISHLKSSNILLDIVKPGVSCCSLRFCEAIIYEKRLITNNLSIKKLKIYNENQFQYFDDIERISTSFIKDTFIVDRSLKKEVSPIKFFNFICSKLYDDIVKNDK